MTKLALLVLKFVSNSKWSHVTRNARTQLGSSSQLTRQGRDQLAQSSQVARGYSQDTRSARKQLTCEWLTSSTSSQVNRVELASNSYNSATYPTVARILLVCPNLVSSHSCNLAIRAPRAATSNKKFWNKSTRVARK